MEIQKLRDNQRWFYFGLSRLLQEIKILQDTKIPLQLSMPEHVSVENKKDGGVYVGQGSLGLKLAFSQKDDCMV